jgi:tetratricopeptide (TPR) repeat protein
MRKRSVKMAEMYDYYELLKIPRSATMDEIREAITTRRTETKKRTAKAGAYGLKAREDLVHIDKAEQILLDANTRLAYDEELSGKKEKVTIEKGEKDWLSLAERYFNEQDMELARSAIRKAMRQQPEASDVFYLASQIFFELEDWESANEASYEVTLLDEDNPYAYGLRAEVLLAQKGEYSKASQQFKKGQAAAKLADNQAALQYTTEGIARCEMFGVVIPVASVEESIPEEFTYNKEIMDLLRSVKQAIEVGKNRINDISAGISNPSAQLQDLTRELNDGLNESIQEIQSLISAGEKMHIQWGRLLKYVGMGVLGLLFAMPVLAWLLGFGGGAFMFVLSALVIIGGIATNVKPVYKWGNAPGLGEKLFYGLRNYRE